MSKKFFGGISLLIFVMTLLVVTSNAYSHENRHDWYQTTIDYRCISGEIVASISTWKLVKWTDDNHPPKTWRRVTECWDEYDWDKEEWVVECETYWTDHVEHRIIGRLYYNHRKIIRHASPNRCRSLR